MNKKDLIIYYLSICEKKLSTEALESQLDKIKSQYPHMTYGGMLYTLWYAKKYKKLNITSLWIIPHLYDESEDYLDATELVKSMGAEIDALRAENEELKKSMEDTQNSVVEIAKALGTPMARQSVVAKSIGNGGSAAPTNNKRPTNADFDTFKNALCKSAQGGRIGIDEVQFLNSEFQKSMKGGIKAVKPAVWSKICSIVRENQ